MTDNYQDPENVDEIIEELKRSKNIESVVDLIKRVYPTWILYYLRKYSEDYPHLQSNWEFYCTKEKVRPAHIMIVEEFLRDDKHKLIGVFAELFTICGFIVRSPKDIYPCDNCDCALPSPERFSQMKNSGTIKLNILEWSPKCSKC